MKVSLSKAFYLIRWLLVLGLALFLLQQGVAIVTGFVMSRAGIEEVPCRDLKVTHTAGVAKIPKMVHQMWKDADLSTYPRTSSNANWKKTMNVTLWTDESIDRLIEQEYSWLYPLYKSYPHNIQRADVSRLVVIHKCGGVYADLDAYPLNHTLDDFFDSDLTIYATFDGNAFSNHFIMAPKNSEIIMHLLENLYKHDVFLPTLPYLRVFMSTGPIFITRELKNLTSKGHYDIVILKEEEQKYVMHEAGRSWHSLDAIILNYVADYPHFTLLFCVLAILLGLWCRKWLPSVLPSYFGSSNVPPVLERDDKT